MKLKDQINAYLTKKNTDYAIMLTGKWGCGKTYFIENFEKEYKRKYINHSLNGAIKVSDVINSIYMELFTSGKHKEALNQGKKITSIITDFLKEKSEKIKIFMNISSSLIDYYFDSYIQQELKDNANNTVVILDDLERISDMLDITDLLGTIHTKLALNGVKVIYIADDDEIKDREKFNKEKEKYIQRVLNFTTDKNDVLTSFLNDYGINTQNYLASLNDVFDEPQINLRTVKFCLECYNEIYQFYKSLSSDEYTSPEPLFYSICQICKFYRDGHSDKVLLKQELDSYYIKSHYSNKNENQKTDYEIFAENYGSKLIKESFLFDIIFDGLLMEEALKFYLRKPKYNQDPLFALTDVLEMETSELKETLSKVIQNLKIKKYTIMEYATLRDSFLPNVKKINLGSERAILTMISESIFAEQNKKELDEMFMHWLNDPFSRIKNAKNTIEKQLLQKFNNFCQEIDSSKTESFYQCLVKCDKKILDYKFDYNIFTLIVQRNYTEQILSLSNKSLRYFAYFINSEICRLINAYDFYYSELPALEQLLLQCEEKQKLIDNDDVLKIDAINHLKITVEQAIKQIRAEVQN